MKQENINKIKELLNIFDDKKSTVLPALYIAQEEYGFIDKNTFQELEDITGIDRFYIESVATFYTMYKKQKTGKYVFYVCSNISCMLNRAENILNYLLKKLNIKLKEITEDGLFSVEEVECLGDCDGAPCLMVNDVHYSKVTEKKIDEILNKIKEQEKNGN